jgi:hypothetical protein
VYFDRTTERLSASNGWVIVDLPAEDVLADEVTGFISPRAILYAAKYTKGRLTRLEDATLVDGVRFPHPPIDKPFPSWQALLPLPIGHELWLDAALLSQLAQALYGQKSGPLRVCLRWLEGDNPIYVWKHDQEARDGQALLMPISQEPRRRAWKRHGQSRAERACLAEIAEAAARYAARKE